MCASIIIHKFIRSFTGKLEIALRAIQCVKSNKDTTSSENLVSQQLEHKHVPNRGTEAGVWNGKRSLIA